MAVTQATTLADFTSGIGTAGAVFQVDNANNRIGIGTTNPQSLLDVDGDSTFRGKVHLLDNDKLHFGGAEGDSGDLQIYHDGANSYISDQGTGDLRLSGNIVKFNNHDNTATMVKATQGGSVELNHDNNLKFETTGIGVSVSNGAASTATIAGPANLVIDPTVVGDNTGLVRIKGDLFVDGTQTVINSTTLEISDFIVGIASTATTDLLTDGAGIKIGPNNTFLYEHNSGTNPSLKSSENLNVASGKGYQINQTEVLNATTLGSNVVSSSLTSVGTLSNLTVSGRANIGASDLNNRAVNAINASTTVGAVSANNHNANGILFQGYNSSVDANNASFVVESDGSTGIGTGVAGAPLHVLSTGYPTAIIQRNHAVNYPRFRLINTANDGADLDGLGDGTGGFRIACVAAGVSTERFRIASNGYVGMNLDANVSGNATVTPWTNLHVVGSNVADGVAARTNSTPTGQLHVSSSGYGIDKGGTISLGSEADNVNPNAAYASISGRRASATSYHYQGYLTLNVSDGTTLNEKLRIDSSGRVGINKFTHADATASALTIQNGATGSEHSILDIVCNDNETSRIYFSEDSNSGKGSIRYTYTADGNYMGFYTNGVLSSNERLRITSGGSVGIGTDNPQGILHVSDGANGLEFNVNNQSAIVSYDRVNTVYRPNGLQGSTVSLRIGGVGTALHVDSSADVGIGTDIPQSKLEVAGTISQTVIEYPTIRPTLDLNFAATKVLDDRVTFTRDSLGTYTDDMGILKYASNNTPRFDHNFGTGESLGLLIEESRTNNLTYSQDFVGQWTNQNFVRTENYAIAPDGTQTATRLQAPSVTDPGSSAYLMRTYDPVDYGSGVTVTFSVFVKPITTTSTYSPQPPDGATVQARDLYLHLTLEGGGGSGWFNLNTKETGTNVTAVQYGNGWWRVSYTGTTTSADNQNMHFIMLANRSGAASFDPYPDGNEDIYIWGAQSEVGAFATSYISTSGSTVTRAKDKVKFTGTNFTDFYGVNEHSFLLDFNLKNTNSTDSMVILSVPNATYPWLLYRYTDNHWKSYNGSNSIVNVSSTYSQTNNKFAFGFDSSNGSCAYNGSLTTTNNSNLKTGSYLNANTMIIFAREDNNSFPASGHLKQLKYYNKRLPNAQLQGLTHQ